MENQSYLLNWSDVFSSTSSRGLLKMEELKACSIRKAMAVPQSRKAESINSKVIAWRSGHVIAGVYLSDHTVIGKRWQGANTLFSHITFYKDFF